MQSGLDSYDNGTKTNWRGWAWNRMVERITVPPQQARVLYLIGPDDLDRAKAISKGFKNENLIGVDWSEENVKRCRKAGGYAVQGDFIDTVAYWPDDLPIHGIMGDFCSGLHWRRLQGTFEAIGYSDACDRVAFVGNFQRGRDPLSVDMRKLILGRYTGPDQEWMKNFYLKNFQGDGHVDYVKHRGWLFYAYIAAIMFKSLPYHKQTSYAWDHLWHFAIPKFFSYKSNRVWMDSVAFRTLHLRNAYPADTNLPELKQVRRKVAALKAIQTMRGVNGGRHEG